MRRLLAGTLCCFVNITHAIAQDWVPMVVMEQPTFDTSAVIMGDAMNRMVNEQIMSDIVERSSSAKQPARMVRPSADQSHQTSYAISASARDVATEFVARLRLKHPAVASHVEGQMRQHDFGQVYAGIIAPFGLRRGDAADSLTAYTLLGWMIANERTDPTRSQVAAARRALAANVSTNPSLKSEPARARLGEETAILFVLLHAGWQSARREGKLQAYSDGVAAMFRKQTGNDLRSLVLTDRGLERRG